MMYTPKTKPWKHQAEALRRAYKKRGFAYFMEMGTGKSKVVIDEFGNLFMEGLIDTVVIMAPKGVYMSWFNEQLPNHMPDDMYEAAAIVTWEAGGGNRENQRELEQLLKPARHLRILVINVEAVSTPGIARSYLEQFLCSGRCYWALDESTKAKNPQAQRTKFIVTHADLAAFRRIMTGSPVTRSPLDLYSQFEFIQRGFLGQSFYSFRARHAVLKDMRYGGRKVTVVVGYRNTEDLVEKIAPVTYRVTKEECMDLPAKIYTRRVVDLTDEQQRMYVEIRDNAIVELGEGVVSATIVLTQLLRLQQIVCGHLKDDDGIIHDIKSNRLDVMMDALEEVAGKAIIWSRFRRDTENIVAALEKEYGPGSVAQFHGGNAKTRQEDVRRFLEEPVCRFMVSNQHTGGYGNTWIVATTVLYYSNDFDLEARIQSEDRAHRGGQTEHVTYIDLVTPGTIDEKLIAALRAKIDVAATITGDGYREWLV